LEEILFPFICFSKTAILSFASMVTLTGPCNKAHKRQGMAKLPGNVQ
jgi:hypothetical protein